MEESLELKKGEGIEVKSEKAKKQMKAEVKLEVKPEIKTKIEPEVKSEVKEELQLKRNRKLIYLPVHQCLFQPERISSSIFHFSDFNLFGCSPK